MTRAYDWLRPWRRVQRLIPLPDDERAAVWYALLERTWWPGGARLAVERNECWVERRRWRWSA